MASIQTYDWITSRITHIFLLVRCSKHAVATQYEERCAMKMTDQLERELFQTELTSGLANHRPVALVLVVATIVTGVLLFASILMISFGR